MAEGAVTVTDHSGPVRAIPVSTKARPVTRVKVAVIVPALVMIAVVLREAGLGMMMLPVSVQPPKL